MDDAFHLTALDVRRYDFGNALRGYDRSRVDQFRDQVAEEFERLTRINQDLEQKARNFHEQLKSFRDRDKALNDALVSAQQLRDDIRQQAEREASLIVREAGAEAERQLKDIHESIRRAQDELQNLWRARRAYLSQLRHHLERHTAELNAADSEPAPAFMASRENASAGNSAASAEASSSVQSGTTSQQSPSQQPPSQQASTQPSLSTLDSAKGSGSTGAKPAISGTPHASQQQQYEEEFVELTPELRELDVLRDVRNTRQRPAAPTPSWLDVIIEE